MKIGLIVYSNTGNTLSVAKKAVEALKEDGHAAVIEQIRAVNFGEMNAEKIQLNQAPDIGEYDAVILGAPIHGFALSSVMTAYLLQCGTLKEKRVGCFVTQFLPHPVMGGNRAIEQMKNLCAAKDAKILDTSIVNWMNIRRRKLVNDTVEMVKSIVRND